MYTTHLLVAIAALASVGLVSGLDNKLHTRKNKKTLRNKDKHNNEDKLMDAEDVAFWTRILQGERGKETEISSMPTIPRPPSPVLPPNRTSRPTRRPVMRPTPDPTRRVTPNPTRRVTPNPTRRVTPNPTRRVTPNPTRRVTPNPTRRVTPNPTNKVTPNPTNKVTPNPTPPVPTPPTPGPPAFNCPPTTLVGCTAVDPENPTDECETVGEPCLDGNDGEFCCLDACPRKYCTAKQGQGPARM